MKITIKGTALDLTPSIKTYITTKLEGISKFVKRQEEHGPLEAHVEVARTTKHHRQGMVFMAEINLKLPKKLLRATEYHEDARKAIDAVKKTILIEIAKYKTKHGVAYRQSHIANRTIGTNGG
jgi:ribosomal subunit interface protein